MNSNLSHIRNFCIIAHIDHGKSTLADRLLEITGTVTKREMKEQLLDQMDIEREKGITIKLQPVRMAYEYQDKHYQLNLIDTPGHVDFSYEVSRSLQACEGAVLIVDAAQGIQAQTLANVYLAMEAELEIIPVMNKIDLPAANPDKVAKEIISLLGCKREEILEVSAKTGKNVESVLSAVIDNIPPPAGQPSDGSPRALVFDSHYDEYQGVIMYIKMVAGRLSDGDEIKMIGTGAKGVALKVGFLNPKPQPTKKLETGEVGYVVTNFKTVREAKVGDTITQQTDTTTQPIPGYKEVNPFVYAGVFPASAEDYQDLKDAMEKLVLNDAALLYEPENSQILGFGFRVGFLGLLHMDIVKERLERHYNIEIIVTNPSTDYKVSLITGENLDLRSASMLPDPIQIEDIKEPWIVGEIIVPSDYVGGVIQLIVSTRGQQRNISYMDDELATVSFEAPLANMLTDFYDQLKSITSGYGTMNYEIDGYRSEDLVRLDILVGGDRVDSLSIMTHRSESQRIGREITKKLKDVIPRQMFEVAIQAAIGGKIIARETISAMKKNVTGHLYGGDVSRKKKLWAKQKAGKARMKKFGKVEIPNEAFTVLIKRD